jgi:hypothetical protein
MPLGRFMLTPSIKSADDVNDKHDLESEGVYSNDEIGETSVGFKCQSPDDRLDIAIHLYHAMCARYPGRQIMLCDGDGRILVKTSPILK